MLALVKEVSTELVVRKSKFISIATPCGSADELKAKKDALWLLHKGARHIVHAAVFSNLSLFSYSDDKEPKGTAGLPTFEVLKGAKAVNIALFTIRYFGGVLLGTGGLRRAYGDSAKQCIEKAEFAEVKEFKTLDFTASYQDIGRLKRLFSESDVEIIKMEEGADVKMTLGVANSDFESMKGRIEEIIRTKIV
ncbi:MAG TPA: hypothetical protein DCO86_01320 [Spirochaetaceae bacterium]|nr:hypothetical protein [Spirochaetaceae bacterium]